MKKIFSLICLLFFSQFIFCDVVSDIAEEYAYSVVTINVAHNDLATSSATGFVVSPNGIIATNYHTVDDALAINVNFKDGQMSGSGRIIAYDEALDISLIRIDAENLHPVIFGNSDLVSPGQRVIVIGSPKRLQNTITDGLLSQIRKKEDTVFFHQISAPISEGSSGSPVFNANGEVISMIKGTYQTKDTQNLNFAIPINDIANFMRKQGLNPPLKQVKKLNALDKFVLHIQKSWQILKEYFSTIFK